MALLHDPGKFMPRTIADFDGASWMITWTDGPWHLYWRTEKEKARKENRAPKPRKTLDPGEPPDTEKR